MSSKRKRDEGKAAAAATAAAAAAPAAAAAAAAAGPARPRRAQTPPSTVGAPAEPKPLSKEKVEERYKAATDLFNGVEEYAQGVKQKAREKSQKKKKRAVAASAAQAASASAASPASAAGAAAAAPALLTVSKLHKRSLLNLRVAKNNMDVTEKEPALRFGAIGGQGAGKTTALRAFLIGSGLKPQPGSYASTALSEARTLTADQRKNAMHEFPDLLKDAGRQSVTHRSVIFVKAPYVRLTRVVIDDKALLSEMAELGEQPQLKTEAALLAWQERLQALKGQFLFDSKDKLAHNVWDDLLSGVRALEAAQQEAEANPEIDLGWCATVFEGPWRNLQVGQHYYDLPGMTDPNKVRVRLAQHMARELNLLLLASRGRLVEQDDLNMCAFLFGPQRDLPSIAALFPHAKVMTEGRWLKQVEAHGGLLPFSQGQLGDTGVSVQQQLQLALQQARQDFDQKLNQFKVWPNLTGDLRLHVFEQLLRPRMPVTLLSYTANQWEQLRDKQLLAGIEGTETGIGGSAALSAHLKYVSDARLQARLLEAQSCIRAALRHLDMWIVAQRRLKRSTDRVQGGAHLAATLLKRMVKHLGSSQKLEDEAEKLQPWVWDELQAEFNEELRLRILHMLNMKATVQRAPSAQAHKELRASIEALHSWASYHSLGQLCGPERRCAWLRSLFGWLTNKRLRDAFDRCYLAIHMLLNAANIEPERLPEEVDRVLSQDVAHMAEMLRVCMDSYSQVAGASEAADAAEAGAGVGAQDVNKHLSGSGVPNPAAQRSVMREVLPSMYQQMRAEAHTWIQQAQQSEWLNTHLERFAKKPIEALLQRLLQDHATPQAHANGGGAATDGDLAAAAAAAVSSSSSSSPLSGQESVARVHEWIEQWIREQQRGWLCKLTSSQPKSEDGRALRKVLIKDQFSDEYRSVFVLAQAETHAPLDVFRRALGNLQDQLHQDEPRAPSTAVLNSTNVELRQLFAMGGVTRLRKELMPSDAVGGLQELPPVAPAAEQPEIFFDVQPVPVRSLMTPPDTFPPPRSRVIDHCTQDFLTHLRTNDTFAKFPKRVLLDFQDGDPATRKMQLFAYDGLLSDVRRCVSAQLRHNGLAPIFISSHERATTAKLQELYSDKGLECRDHPDSLVFLLVEQEQAVNYCLELIKLKLPADNLVLVVIPGKERGVRFSRACAVYLASCLRAELLKGGSPVPLDLMHTLDDDWKQPRFFDPTRFSSDCMRPCSLFALLLFQQRVLLHELGMQDGRRLLAEAGDSARVAARDQEFSEFLEGVMNFIFEKTRKFARPGEFMQLLASRHAEIIRCADDNVLLDAVDRFVNPDHAAPVWPDFKDKFLEQLDRLRLANNKVAQVAITTSDITGLNNYNLAAVFQQQAGKIKASDAPSAPAGAGASHAATGSAAGGGGSSASAGVAGSSASSGSSSADSSDDSSSAMDKLAASRFEYFHYRVSRKLCGCVTHFLPVYQQRQVNYVSARDMFLSQADVNVRLANLDLYLHYFADDSSFAAEVLAPRGIGGFCVFKFDMVFHTHNEGGVKKFLNRCDAKLKRNFKRKPKAQAKPKEKRAAKPKAATSRKRKQPEPDAESDETDSDLSSSESDDGPAPMDEEE